MDLAWGIQKGACAYTTLLHPGPSHLKPFRGRENDVSLNSNQNSGRETDTEGDGERGGGGGRGEEDDGAHKREPNDEQVTAGREEREEREKRAEPRSSSTVEGQPNEDLETVEREEREERGQTHSSDGERPNDTSSSTTEGVKD